MSTFAPTSRTPRSRVAMVFVVAVTVAMVIGVAMASVLLAGCSTTTATPTTDVPASASVQRPGASVPGASTDAASSATQRSGMPEAESRYAGLAPERASSALSTMTVAQLPAEGIETLQLITQGGPFPYRKDGSTFGNRERRLPSREYGFYAEYTVPTPGESDRGPRRLVVGDDGSVFYTSDHYGSFREVIAG